MAVLQPDDPNKKYIYTLRPDAEVNDIYYVTSLGTRSVNNEYDVDGTVCADRNISSIKAVEVTIDSGSTTSDAVGTGLFSLDGTQLVGVTFPAAMTSSAMTFSASDTEDGTYTVVRTVDGASDYSITVTASKYVPVDPRVFSGTKYIKLICGSSEAAARTIKILLNNIN